MAEQPNSQWEHADGRRRLLLYSPGHRARGKVPREVNLLRQRWQIGDLDFQACQAVTGERVVILTPHGPGSAGRIQLEREIKIGSRLWLAAEPAMLARLIGFDDDTDADPPLALFSYSGTPLARTVGQLTTSDRMHAALGLLAALEQLSQARVVHRALSPDTVLWDGSQKSVQVTRFGQAAILGEARAGGVAIAPWCAPEQASGIGQASAADDLYSAALLLFWLYTEEEPAGEPAAMRERLALQDDELQRRLKGMFSDRAVERPSLEQLSRRWRPRMLGRTVPPKVDDEARRNFAALRERQRADATPLFNPSVVVPAPMLSAANKRLAATLIAVVVIAVIVAGLAGGL
jgi:hypothetical protein